MRRSVIVLAGVGAFATIAATDAQAACWRGGYRFGPGIAQTATLWRVKTGTPCISELSPGIKLFLQGMSIERQANHGVAGVSSRYQYGYNPSAGFVGRDQFVLRINYNRDGAQGSTRVLVNVDVR